MTIMDEADVGADLFRLTTTVDDLLDRWGDPNARRFIVADRSRIEEAYARLGILINQLPNRLHIVAAE